MALPDITRLRYRCNERRAGTRTIFEMSRAHQIIIAAKFIEMMKHQHPLAQTIGAHLETRSIGRERVRANRPPALIILYMNVGRLALIVSRLTVLGIVFAIIKNDFEHPVSTLGEIFVWPARSVVTILDTFKVTLRRATSIPLVSKREIHSVGVLDLVFVTDRIAFVVVTFAD